LLLRTSVRDKAAHRTQLALEKRYRGRVHAGEGARHAFAAAANRDAARAIAQRGANGAAAPEHNIRALGHRAARVQRTSMSVGVLVFHRTE
jgi:hypothetical protein